MFKRKGLHEKKPCNDLQVRGLNVETEPGTQGLWQRIDSDRTQDNVAETLTPRIQVVNCELAGARHRGSPRYNGAEMHGAQETMTTLYKEHRLAQEKNWQLKCENEYKIQGEMRCKPLIDDISAEITRHMKKFHDAPNVVDRLYPIISPRGAAGPKQLGKGTQSHYLNVPASAFGVSKTVDGQGNAQSTMTKMGEDDAFATHRPSINEKSLRLRRTLNDLLVWEDARRFKMNAMQKENMAVSEMAIHNSTTLKSYICDGSKRLLTSNEAARQGKIEEQLLAQGARVQKKLQKRRDEGVEQSKSARPKINANTDKLLAQRYARLQNTEEEILTIDCPDEQCDYGYEKVTEEPQQIQVQDVQVWQGKCSADLNKFEVIVEEKEEDELKCTSRADNDEKAKTSQLIGKPVASPRVCVVSQQTWNKSPPCSRLNRDKTERSPKATASTTSYTELYHRRKTVAAAFIPFSTRKDC